MLTGAKEIADKVDSAATDIERALNAYADHPDAAESYAALIAAGRRLASDLRDGATRPAPVRWVDALAVPSTLAALRAHGREPLVEQAQRDGGWQRDAELFDLLRQAGCKNPELVLKGRYSTKIKN